MQILTKSLGKTTEDIEILLFLKEEPEKECFQQQILKRKFSF